MRLLRWIGAKMGFSEYQSTSDTTVMAEEVTEQRSIITPNGPVTATEGEWEVRHPDGNVEKLSADAFNEKYQGGSAEPSTVSATSEENIGVDSDQNGTVTQESSGQDSDTDSDEKASDTSAESGKTTEKSDSKDSPL